MGDPTTTWTDDNLMSLQSHVLAGEREHPGATGDFSWILSAISLATKTIGNKVRRARIEDVIGELASNNTHGEQQQKLDVIANEIIKSCLGSRANIGVLVSEEDEEPTILRTRSDGGRYAVFFDPLDGSSNIDVSVGVGTIFGVLRLPDGGKGGTEALLSPEAVMVAAGYVLYGSSTVFVLTTGNGVDMFVLDHSIGSYVLTKRDIRIPTEGKIYSINEAYSARFQEHVQTYLQWAHDNDYSSRYIGSMVADVHRTLLKGGVFLYPATSDRPEGKLRMLYEALPMAMLIEQAGGRAVTDHGTRILDLKASTIHERTSVVLGSSGEVDLFEKHSDTSL
ncbi:MAG: class 1 fructose-bisphosphatase [Planctomycetes bacterium]|nr:class 1 fructose-bisphosphatase [Planctomycetota bacterium]MCP4838882.1 class 1 fructose-bisphosphatase [Planctomycetota bacterium]